MIRWPAPWRLRWRRAGVNLLLALVAVALALVIWFLVTDAQVETIEERLGFGLVIDAVNTPNGLALANRFPTASITITGEESDIAGVTPEDFATTVDLTALEVGEHLVPVRVQSLADGVRVRAVVPESVNVILEPVEERTLAITVAVGNPPPLGFEVGAPQLSLETVTVSGIRQLVELVDELVAAVDLRGATVDVALTTTLQARTATGAAVSGLLIQPSAVEVRIPIQQLTFRRSVAVEPQIVGRPAAGYRVLTVDVDPLSVVVVGTLEALERVGSVPTAAVSVEGADADLVADVDLLPPGGLALEEETIVRVRVQVEPLVLATALELPLVVTDLAEGLSATVEPVLVTVVMDGPAPDVADLIQRLRQVSVSAADLEPGEHSLRVEVEAPPGVTVTVIPGDVQVTLVVEEP